MVLHGRIENGAVVLPEYVSLPNGTEVTIIVQATDAVAEPKPSRERVQLPLVRSKQPGSRRLTADRVAELLDEDDLSA